MCVSLRQQTGLVAEGAREGISRRLVLSFKCNQYQDAPLRDRKEDIPLLVKHFIEKYNKKENRQVKGISPEVEKEFYGYNWPGNVRELRMS